MPVFLLSFFSVSINPMLQRFFIHFSLVVLFALTQMGVATHEISHLSDLSQQNQPSKQNKQLPQHQCEQCISHADVESALATNVILLALNPTRFVPVSELYVTFFKPPKSAYSARAPPQTAQI